MSIGADDTVVELLLNCFDPQKEQFRCRFDNFGIKLTTTQSGDQHIQVTAIYSALI